jgi:transposase
VHLTPGQWADSAQASALLGELQPLAVVADKAYGTNAIVEGLTSQGIQVVIAPKANRVGQREYDKNLYADRNKIKRFFNLLKNNRRIATHYDKTASSFLSFIYS